MPKQTPTYRLGYYVEGELTDSTTEQRRFVTIDYQLRGLYEILGNGVINGWQVTKGSGLSVTVAPGSGVVSFISSKTTRARNVTGVMPKKTQYIYAFPISNTYWTRDVNFSISTSRRLDSGILLAKIVSNETEVVSVDTSIRTNIGLIASVRDVVKQHRHIGGEDNPDLVNLQTDVQGTLSQANIPSLDTSKVLTGVFDAERIPKISHITGLTDKGVLSHAQIDSLMSNLMNANRTLMGETALVNLLQLVLALKHQWPEVDKYLVNELAFIPGVSPDSLIDTENTTAIVDTRPYSEGGQHEITGTAASAMEISTKTWNTESEFIAAASTRIVVDGDVMRLQSQETSVILDDFEEIGDWQTRIVDLSTASGSMELDAVDKVSGNYSADIDTNPDGGTNIAFVMSKNFRPQDWTAYKTVVFHLKADTIDHGNLYLYIGDSVFGIQNSYTLVLPMNAPTINRDTLMEGWREIHVDVTPYQRSSINTIGIFTSVQEGWDASRPMSFHIDKMTLTSGNTFVINGYSRFIFSGSIPSDFFRVRWDSLNPAGTSMRVRTRLANDLAQFQPSSPVQATWSSYSSVSGFTISNPTNALYRHAQLEVFLESDISRGYSPELHRLYLDMRSASVQAAFLIDTQDGWEAGTLHNVDTTSIPGSITVASASEADHITYGMDGTAVKADEELSSLLSIAGLSLPESTRQAMGLEPAGLGQVSAVRRGSDGSLWLADTSNDRVVRVDSGGNILFGLYGSLLSDPNDPYGTEDRGPGSNIDIEEIEEESETSDDLEVDKPVILHSIYNPRLHKLYAVFNSQLENLHDEASTFNPAKVFLRAGSHRIYFNTESSFSLLGIDGAKHDVWRYSDNDYIGQFSFLSHVLVADLSQADASALNSIIDFSEPSIQFESLTEQQVVYSSSLQVSFLTPNFDIGSESSDNNKIKVYVDGIAKPLSSTRTVSLTSLTDGRHVISAQLTDSSGNPFDGDENTVETSIVVSSGVFNDRLINIRHPLGGQTITGGTVNVDFLALNHPITNTGPHIKYSVDNGAWITYKKTTPIAVNGLTAGRHTISIKLVSSTGADIIDNYVQSSVSFNYGASHDAVLELCVDEGAIRGKSREDASECAEGRISVDSADIVMVNMFSPLDVQVIPAASEVINPSGGTTVVVAKLRSPSWTTDLAPLAGEGSSIFGTKYLGGHSVAQYGANGETIFTNNAPKFATTRAIAKNSLGSAWKLNDELLMVADPARNRAIITKTSLADKSTRIIWEYESDRLVCDFQPVSAGDKIVSVGNGAVSPSEMYVRTGQTVVWKNDSSIPVRIYSGTTTQSAFAADPDVTLYGDEFSSEEFQPGEQYAFTFDNVGNFAWFVHPSILTGTVKVTAAGISGDDEYLVVEKEDQGSAFGSRVIRIDAWGNVVWTFGEGFLSDPRDARHLPSGSVMISV